jgi:hypothetical protein
MPLGAFPNNETETRILSGLATAVGSWFSFYFSKRFYRLANKKTKKRP